MKRLFRIFLSVVFAANALLIAEEEEAIEIDPFSFFSQAIKDTRLLSVNVSVWFKDQNMENEIVWGMEEALEGAVQKKFAEKGFVADVFQDLPLQPFYQRNPDFYEDQLDLASNLVIDVLKKNDAVFVKIYCYKDYPEFHALIFERTFRIDPKQFSNEQDKMTGWWPIVCNPILQRIDEFLSDFTQINPGPYGWVLP